MSIQDQFGREAHDRWSPEHSDKYGHECPDWDFLYICEDCDEFQACTCEKETTHDKESS